MATKRLAGGAQACARVAWCTAHAALHGACGQRRDLDGLVPAARHALVRRGHAAQDVREARQRVRAPVVRRIRRHVQNGREQPFERKRRAGHLLMWGGVGPSRIHVGGVGPSPEGAQMWTRLSPVKSEEVSRGGPSQSRR